MATKKTTAKKTGNRSSPVAGGTPAAGTGLPAAATSAVPTGRLAANAPPAGLFTGTQALEADVSGELAALAPTFGDVLRSIGRGVAESQEALDRGLVDTARQLSDTDITVVTDVIQELDDDGLPVAAATQLVEQEVSLINFVSPTVHEWSHVALSMDLSVSALDNETGITFEREQSSDTVGGVGLFWGFVGFGLHSESDRSTFVNRNTDQEMDWARGQVRMDAMLRPRDVGGLPAPAQVTIGPSIFFSQGAVTETVSGDVVTARSLELLITVRKADGSVNPNVVIELDPGPLQPAFETGGGFNGNTTNADGEVRVTLTRAIPNPRFARPITVTVTATLGEISRDTEVRL